MNHPVLENHEQIAEFLDTNQEIVDNFILKTLERIGVLQADYDVVLRDVRAIIAADYRTRPDCGAFWSWTSQIATQEAVHHLRRKEQQRLELPSRIGEFNADYWMSLSKFVEKVLRRVPEAERADVVQEVMVVIWMKRESLHTPQAIRGWAAKIAIRRWPRYFKSKQNRRETLLDDMSSKGAHDEDQESRETAVPADEPQPSDYLYWADRASRIEDCIDRLPEPERSVIRRSMQDDEPLRKIMEQTGRSRHIVDQLVESGIRQLRALLAEYLEDTPANYNYRPYRTVGDFDDNENPRRPIVIVVQSLLPEVKRQAKPRVACGSYSEELNFDQIDTLTIEDARRIIQTKMERKRRPRKPDQL